MCRFHTERQVRSMTEEGETGETTNVPSAPAGFVEITEGRAKILFPDTNEVFYNPAQKFNRDLR